MSNLTSKYLAEARRNANLNMANMNGAATRGYSNFTGQNFFHADGGGAMAQQQSAQQSQPYAIQISNSTGNQVNNFPVFGANIYLYGGGTFATNGSFTPTNSGVTISGILSNVSYQYLLAQSMTQPFAIGCTQIVALTNNSQVNTPMTVQTTDANNNQVSKSLIWLTNPFQNQSNTLISNTQFSVDPTTILFMTVLPNAVFTLWFFPMQNVDSSNTLANQALTQQYGNPGLQPANTVVIPSPTQTTIVNRLRS